MIRIKSDREVALMREAGRVVAEALSLVTEAASAGVTTLALDERAEEFIRGRGATPAFKGYRGFPASICVSINEEIVHGIPGERILRNGDVVSVDVGVEMDGYYGDAARTFGIGRISEEAQMLMKVCRGTLNMAVDMLRPGRKLSEVSAAIQRNVEENGFWVIREYVGHGIGHSMHEEPQIPNFAFDVRRDGDVVLKKGMVLALEPMISVGRAKTEVLADGWTAVTGDRSLAAHFEQTVAVRDGGPWILTEKQDA
jgi:methionyl aminopeptidase